MLPWVLLFLPSLRAEQCDGDVMLQLLAKGTGKSADDHCVDKGWFCDPTQCWWRAHECVKTCAEECQPCIDDGLWCAKWLCPVNGKSCRKTCAEHCRVNCQETPELGECKARAAACEMSKDLADWKSRNETLQEMQRQLGRLCNGQPVNLSPEMRDLGRTLGVPGLEDEVPPLKRKCPDGIDKCVPDVREWVKSKPWLVQQAFAVPNWLAKSGVDTLKEVLKASKDILLRGTIAFAFLSAGVSAFFPKFGSDPKSPCDGIEGHDWAKCVWQQIFPLVEEFVDAKFDDFTQKLWDAHLRGWQNRLWYIETTVKENTGDKKYVPEKVSKKMYQDLDSLHQGLIQAAPTFMMPVNKGSIAGLYLSQFAALHVQVITTLLADDAHQTEGFRVTTQEILLCYARLTVKRTLEFRDARLKALEVDDKCGKSRCCFEPVPGQCQFSCKNICHKYKDTWEHCDWSPGKCEIGDSVKCVKSSIVPYGCEETKKDTCSSSSEGTKWDCHVDHVNDQMDIMWSMWLAPVPHWLDIIGKMDELNIKKTSEAPISPPKVVQTRKPLCMEHQIQGKDAVVSFGMSWACLV